MVTNECDTSITVSKDLQNLTLTEVDLPQDKSNQVRELTNEEIEKLAKDTQLVSEFKNKRFEIDAKKHWDLFYRRNKTNFFKDRYWTFREFEEINNENKTLLEIGCGVGNFMYPLIKENKKIFVYACDFSTDAVQLLKDNSEYDTDRCLGFVCDVTKPNSLEEQLAGVKVDFVSLIFVFSALHPDKMKTAVENIAKVMKPNGTVLVRDYGINDHSMIRFDPGHKLAEKFYVRQDGTRSYFFTLEEMEQLFVGASGNGSFFRKAENEYVFRETVNMKEKLRVPRVFIQSKFVRTDVSSS